MDGTLGPFGRVLAALTCVGGIGLIAMPRGILAAALGDAMHRNANAEREPASALKLQDGCITSASRQRPAAGRTQKSIEMLRGALYRGRLGRARALLPRQADLLPQWPGARKITTPKSVDKSHAVRFFRELEIVMSKVRYDRHDEEWDRALGDGDFARLAKTWMSEDTLDYWIHVQIRSAVKPFIEHNPDASWLTVGDGRYGADAHYIISVGSKHVHASDMHDKLLRVGRERGFISEYSAQNAERLTFADDSFDYVYCKEAFHHFPRPYLALYEMFRVARRAVILTEPRDEVVHRARCKSLAKTALGRAEKGHSFEPIGNYVYTISERELEKFLLGMHYRHIAFHGCNTFYMEGVEFVPCEGGTVREKRIRAMIKGAILAMNALEKVGLHKSSLLSAALFKEEPAAPLRERLNAAGWRLKELPRNPYL